VSSEPRTKYVVVVTLLVLVLTVVLFASGRTYLGLAGLVVAAVGAVMAFLDVRAGRRS